MKLVQVTAGFGLTVALPAYGSARVYREYTASVARGENASAIEAELETMARESVLALQLKAWGELWDRTMGRARIICSANGCPMAMPCPTHGGRERSRGWEWSKRVAPAVLARDEHKCVECREPCPHPKHHEVDHIQPYSRGGTDDLSNLQTLCSAHHREKTKDQR